LKENYTRIELPLSWAFTNKRNHFQVVEGLGTKWISLAEINGIESIDAFLNNLKNNESKIIIRGVKPRDLNGLLTKAGFVFYPIGSEAVLRTDSDMFEKRSLRELIRRGLKHGYVKTFIYDEIDWEKFNELLQNSSHSNEPKLKNLYRLEVDSNCLLFVLQNSEKYLAAVSISQNNPNKYQAELLLRRKNAPVGVMEALIYSIKEYLFKQGAGLFSLGEVPFVIMEKELHNIAPLILNACGRSLKFAYNYKGLFNFKNKFLPEWEDVYLAAYPKLSIHMLTNIFLESQLHKLVLYKLLHPNFRRK